MRRQMSFLTNGVSGYQFPIVRTIRPRPSLGLAYSGAPYSCLMMNSTMSFRWGFGQVKTQISHLPTLEPLTTYRGINFMPRAATIIPSTSSTMPVGRSFSTVLPKDFQTGHPQRLRAYSSTFSNARLRVRVIRFWLDTTMAAQEAFRRTYPPTMKTPFLGLAHSSSLIPLVERPRL